MNAMVDIFAGGNFRAELVDAIGNVAVAQPRRLRLSGRDVELRWFDRHAAWQAAVRVLDSVEDPNIIRHIAVYEGRNVYCIAFPLYHALEDTGTHGPEWTPSVKLLELPTFTVVKCLASAVRAMHAMGTAIGGIRPANVVWDPRPPGRAILIPWRLEAVHAGDGYGFYAPELYSAPGVIQEPTLPSDVFALGVTIGCFYAGVMRPTTLTREYVLQRPLRNFLQAVANASMKILVGRMTQDDPVNRPTIAQVLEKLM